MKAFQTMYSPVKGKKKLAKFMNFVVSAGVGNSGSFWPLSCLF